MAQIISSPESDKPQEVEQLFSSAYEKLFAQLGSSTEAEAKNLVTQLLLLSTIEYSAQHEKNYPAQMLGVAERTWPNLIRHRIESYTDRLDIVPSRLKKIGEQVMTIDPKLVTGLPIIVNGSQVFNALTQDTDELQTLRFAIENFCPDGIAGTDEKINRVASVL